MPENGPAYTQDARLQTAKATYCELPNIRWSTQNQINEQTKQYKSKPQKVIKITCHQQQT